MKVLAQTLSKGGFTLTQLSREGCVAVFRQTKPGTSIEAFEVVLIGKQGGRIIKGNALEATELYPRSEDWGVRGWTYQTKAEAMGKFLELTERSKVA